jgi:hypothetical protein
MKLLALASCALGTLLVLADCGRSSDAKDVRAVIDRAVEAHGGAARLAKFKVHTMKGTGKFYGAGDALDFTLAATSHGDKQFHAAIDLNIAGQDLKIVLVVDGAKGWEKINGDVKDMPADELAEHQEQMHADAVIGLRPLGSRDYQLAPLGEVKVGDQPAVGVRVSRKGRRDVNLFFDKAKGHLVKSEQVIKDIIAGGNEANQVVFYSDYKEFQGTRQPTRILVERDGAKFTDTQVTELRLQENADSGTFDRP